MAPVSIIYPEALTLQKCGIYRKMRIHQAVNRCMKKIIFVKMNFANHIGTSFFTLLRNMLFLVLLASGCKKHLDVSKTEELLNGDFAIHVISYGGFAGKGEECYNFKSVADSIEVTYEQALHYPTEKYPFKIDEETFSEIKTRIRCLSTLHHDRVPHVGCQPPFESEYIVKRLWSQIRIYPTNQDTCKVTGLLDKYLPNDGLLTSYEILHEAVQTPLPDHKFEFFFPDSVEKNVLSTVGCTAGNYLLIDDTYVLKFHHDYVIEDGYSRQVSTNDSYVDHIAELMVYEKGRAHLGDRCTDILMDSVSQPLMVLKNCRGDLTIGKTHRTNRFGVDVSELSVRVDELIFRDSTSNTKFRIQDVVAWKIENIGAPG